jgi:hypothetical protein
MAGVQLKVGRFIVYGFGLSNSVGARVDSLAAVRLSDESYFSLVFTSRFLQFMGVANLTATETSGF